MKLSPLDVVLVALFLVFSGVAGYFKVLDPQLVSAIVTGALAFLAMRVKVLGAGEKGQEQKKVDEGAPDKPLEKGHSHRLLIGDDGSVKVEDIDAKADTEKAESDGK